MRIKKKGQIMGLPLVFIIVIVSMAFVIFFGFKALKDVWETKDMAQIGTFILNLEDEVEVIYNLEVGSGKEFLGTGIPKGVEYVCFTDPDLDVNVPVATLDQMDPLFYKHLSVNQKYNVYFVPTDVYPTPSPNFEIDYLTIEQEENPLCFKVVDGVLKMVIESKLEGTEVFVVAKKLE